MLKAKFVTGLEELRELLVVKARNAVESAQASGAREWLSALEQAQKCLELERGKPEAEAAPEAAREGEGDRTG